MYQVALSITKNDTHTREIRALETAMMEYNLKKGYLITLDHQEIHHCQADTIKIIPA